MNITSDLSNSENRQSVFYFENKDVDNDFYWEISKAIKTTLGPSGMEKLLRKKTGEIIISNDGATILDNIMFSNSISKIIAEVARSQDFEVGDGTTSVCLLSLELLKEMKIQKKNTMIVITHKSHNVHQNVNHPSLSWKTNCNGNPLSQRSNDKSHNNKLER